jgi:hypothetical protein
MEPEMKDHKLPKTDSIKKLAEFWGTHDVTDFEGELEEVTEPIFVRGAGVNVPLAPRDVKAVERIARARGVSLEELICTWVRQGLARSRNVGRNPRGS